MAHNAAADNPFFYVLREAVHILFVDDDPIMREFATVHLASDMGRVSVAADGQEALDAIAADPPDIMLLDLEMPRMDGFETLAHLRADPSVAPIPVIVVTGREDISAIDRAFDAGATSFLVKPINWRLLSYQVNYVRRAHQAERAAEDLQRELATAAEQHAVALEVMRGASALIHQAMAAGPELRRTAVQYANLIADLHPEIAGTGRSPA
jgi:DNA-binding response OmpR family regulator